MNSIPPKCSWLPTVHNLRLTLACAVSAGALFSLPVRAATVIWSGTSGTDTNWSNGNNWAGLAAPGAADDVKFYDPGTNLTVGLPSSLVDAGFSGAIGTLVLGNTNGFHTIVIAPGTTLSVLNGNLSMGTPNDPLAGRTLTNTITGAGSTLFVSNLTANLGIEQANSVGSPCRANLNLSGLDNFVFSGNRIGIGDGQFPGVAANNRAGGNLILAKTNVITLAYTDTLADYQLAGKSSAIVMSRNSGNNPGISSFLQLGLVNTFSVDSMNIGMDKSANNSTPAHGIVVFNPAFAGLNPVANFYGAGGPGTRVTWWSIGDGNSSSSSSNGGGGTNDFSLGTVNAFVNVMSLARDASSSSDTFAGPHKGVFIFTSGTVNVNTLILGNQTLETGTSTAPCLGIFDVLGAGALLQINNNLEMGTNTLTTAAGTLTRSLLNITNGTVLANNITVGANSISNIINVVSGSLIVTNTLATNASGLYSLTLSNATLGLTLAANGSVKGLVQTFNTIGATNYIQLNPAPVLLASYPQQIPLIRYTTWNGSNTFGLATIPAWAPGATLVSNGPNKTLDLLLPSNPRPVITSEPAGYSGNPGDNVTFSVGISASSVTPLSYQWYNGSTALNNGPSGTGSTLAGSTTGSLTITSAQPGDDGNYFVVITNVYGSVTSSPAAVLTISAGSVGPSITGPLPTSQTAVVGSNITFTASVSGNPAPATQWQFNGNVVTDGLLAGVGTISGSAGTSLTITGVQYPGAQGAFSIIATNIAGSETNFVNLTVIVPPIITVQPVSLAVTNSQGAFFSVTATGVPAPTYQWYENNSGNPLANATNSVYAIGSAAPANDGTYFVVVQNAAGAVASSNVTLTVNSTMSALSLAPANGATGVCYDTPFYITFSQTPVLRNAGKIRIYNLTNSASAVVTLDLSQNSASGFQARSLFPGDGQGFNYFPVIISGSTAAIYPGFDLLTSNQTYYVTVDDGVFADSAGAYFAGVQGSNTWQFTTKVGGPASPGSPVVAADGSGDFATVQGAVDSLPLNNTNYALINIHNGSYNEIVDISSKANVTFRGQSRTGVIDYYLNNANVAPGGTTHARMAFKINSKNVSVENLTISNSTPQGGGQAEALMIESGASHFILNNAEVDSRQDTLLANQNSSQGYFYNSLIQGNFDYVWGGGNLFFTNCELRTITGTTSPNLTASRTDNGVNGNWPGYLGLNVSNGFSFVNCQLTRSTNTVTNCTMADANGSTNGNAVWINCSVDTGCYIDAVATALNSQLLWEYGNSNLTDTVLLDNTQVPFLSFTQLNTGDARYIAAANATTWLNGWQPQLAPNLLSQPTNETVYAGQTASFTVSATGIPNASYQWLQNGTNAPYASANSATLTIPNARSTDASTLSVVVSNAAGSVTSSSVTLTVITPTPPVLSLISVSGGGGVQFSISGTAGLNYRVWATTNLLLSPVTSTWTLLNSNVFGSSPVTFRDSSATNLPLRFYTVTVP